mgnify:CR=1 FL=1
MKQEGCTHVIATTACGSLREEIKRSDIVILDQLIDFTRLIKLTFFDEFKNGDTRHTQMADPFDEHIRKKIIETCEELNLAHHKKGTVITIEGPRFSTRAESKMFRQWGADVINMSITPECILANEIGIKYVAIAISRDYDCWKTYENPVSWSEILEIFQKNADNVKKVIMGTISKMCQ